jgi:branched-chain amino acid transport system substrate-binding protein
MLTRLLPAIAASTLVVSACSSGTQPAATSQPQPTSAPPTAVPAAAKAQSTAQLAATPQPAAAGQGATVKFASIHPLTGALASSGIQMDRAVKLAVDTLNGAGGIKALNSAKLEAMSADTQGKPDVAQSEAQRLMDGGAAAIIGTYQSAATVTVAQAAERAQVPLIIDVSVADNITQNGYKYTFRVQPNATSMGTYGARYLKQIADKAGQPVKTVGYLHEPSDFGTSVFSAFKSEAEKQGMTISKEVTYELTNTDLTAQATQALAGNPDVLAVTGYFADGVTLAKNLGLIKPGIKAVWGVANGAFDAPDFPAAVGNLGNTYFDANYHYDASSKHLQEVRAQYKQQFGEDMRTEAVYAYQDVYVLAEALERAGSADPRAIRDALAKTALKSDLLPMLGPIEFDERGENTNAAPIINQVQGDQVLQVFPDNAAEKPPIFPGTPWS